MILEKKIKKVSIDFVKFRESTMEQFRNVLVLRESTTPEHTQLDLLLEDGIGSDVIFV